VTQFWESLPDPEMSKAGGYEHLVLTTPDTSHQLVRVPRLFLYIGRLAALIQPAAAVLPLKEAQLLAICLDDVLGASPPTADLGRRRAEFKINSSSEET
jgi:hypothetical protein